MMMNMKKALFATIAAIAAAALWVGAFRSAAALRTGGRPQGTPRATITDASAMQEKAITSKHSPQTRKKIVHRTTVMIQDSNALIF